MKNRFADMPFGRRLIHVALFWGLPVLVIDALVVWRVRSWVSVVLLAVGTAVGVFVLAALEHAFFTLLRKSN